ncbi:ABC transporter ATP-binding protein [Ferriphaselus sp. R-1]|uniref:ABC transporter ATP-binding protein n=1 Tax=Ferriphaselus sp. R-1 TaxID=1485544 RepID=UPI00055975B9|nr:ABC transporter ATP-binding protein [Ferriphaselus sp. R-1]
MLEVSALSFRYPGAAVPALENVSLTARAGEVLGLLGPNGAGKTTLIAHLSGLLAIQDGDISLDGQPLASLRARQPTRIAVAPQEYAFYPTLTVTENLACFAGVGGLSGTQARTRIAECLAFSQLERHVAVRADRLSGGLKRRLNLAIALLHRPELLLFDEPTVGVDPQSRAFLLDAVKALAAQGCAVIYTSHYMEEVEAIADRVVILDQGKVLRQGALSDLLGADATELQLAVAGEESGRLTALLSPFGHVTRQGDGVRLSLDARQDVAAVVAAVAAAGLEIRRMRYGHADLEQLFMALTKRSLRD